MFINYECKKGAKLYIHKSSWTEKTTFLYFSFMLFWCFEEKTTIANNGNKFRKNKNFSFYIL